MLFLAASSTTQLVLGACIAIFFLLVVGSAVLTLLIVYICDELEHDVRRFKAWVREKRKALWA